MTKIKTDHIRALEAGDYHVFCAAVYIRGFVRTYATLLKLDLDPLMATLETELSQLEQFRDPPSLGGEREGWLDFLMLQLSKIHVRLLIPAVLVIAVVLAGYYTVRALKERSARDPLSTLGPGLYQAPVTGTNLTLPLPTNSPAKQR